LKSAIKTWSKEENHHSNAAKSSIMSRLVDLDRLVDQGNGTDVLMNERTVLLKDLQDIHNRSSLDMAQKAKIRWSIERDENSKYFHVKNEFLNRFTNRFSNPNSPKIYLSSQMLKNLTLERVEDLERSVTYDEIKRAVWDCGTNKSPGPDGLPLISFVDIGKPSIKMWRNFLFLAISIQVAYLGTLHGLTLLKKQLPYLLKDVWLDDHPLKLSFPRLYTLECDKEVSVAAKLIDSSLTGSFRRNPRGRIEEEKYLLRVEKVASVILSNSNDRWTWFLMSSGEFSVKSARIHIDDILLPSVGYVTRWVHVVPIKINVFAWKVCLDKLPTRFNLSL
nr:RNA-directed DNA polymerase, eukaryota [Tanacetum cinerariifolium]